MCWSPEVSIGTFFVGIIVSIHLLARAGPFDKTLATFIMVYSLTQLFEAVIWLDQKGIGWNQLATKGIYLTLIAQPLVISLSLYWEALSKGKLGKMNRWMVLISSIYFFVELQFIFTYKNWISEEKNGHLSWSFLGDHARFYMIGIVLIMVMLMLGTRQLSFVLLFGFLYALSYYISLGGTNGNIGSYWCWLSVLASAIFIPIDAKRLKGMLGW